MIEGKEKLDFKYFALHLKGKIELNIFERKIIEKYFREELLILPEHQIDFDNLELRLVVDIIRYSSNLS